MIDAAAYRSNETNAKRAIADWRLCNINDPYVFQNQGFPVRADSFLDLAQILDTMQEGRFDYYLRELGGFTEEDTNVFVNACLDYVGFYTSLFHRERVVVPLSTLIAHFVAYKKLIGYDPGFTRVLELGPGCGYLSFFLRHHAPLADYTQIESTESFYLLQSHINSHVFGSGFAEHALSRHALQDHGKYVPKLNWHNPFHYEEQKSINVRTEPICHHFPWWRIGDVATRKYDIVASNANLNEFSREALFQYLSLIRDVLTDDGAIVAQCLGGGPPSYDAIFTSMKSAGFVPVALIGGGASIDGRVFVVSNGVFVGERHPLYSKYVDKTPQFPMIDRGMPFQNKMYFLNEEESERKRVYSTFQILEAVTHQVEENVRRAGHAPRARSPADVKSVVDMDKILSSTRLRENVRLRIAVEADTTTVGPDAEGARFERQHLWNETKRLAAQADALVRELGAVRASTSWKLTGPVRSVGRFLKSLRN